MGNWIEYLDIDNNYTGNDIYKKCISKKLQMKEFNFEEYDELLDLKKFEEASEIVKEAENRIISMIDEHEITRKAYEQKNKIIENANDMAREIANGTKAYADNILAGVQVTLEDALRVIENNRKELQIGGEWEDDISMY